MVPPAPGRVSTTDGLLPKLGELFREEWRATVSAEPPAEKPDTIFTVRDGKSCAAALTAKTATIAAIKAAHRVLNRREYSRANDLAPRSSAAGM